LEGSQVGNLPHESSSDLMEDGSVYSSPMDDDDEGTERLA